MTRRRRGKLQQSRNFRRVDSLAEQVALPLRASVFLETGRLLGILDAFGDCRQAEPASKSKDGANDHQAFLVLSEPGHEALVNFDLIKMKGKQLSECGITRSKIIERNTHTCLPKPVNYNLRGPDIVYKRALGDLNLQAKWVESALANHCENARPEGRVTQLDG